MAERATQTRISKAKRPRLLVADEELELDDSYFLAPGEDSEILREERYIPADPYTIRMREIYSNPDAYFLPITTVGNQTMMYAGPADLAPELAAMFSFPTNILRRGLETEAEAVSKRPRMTGSEGVEYARRQSAALSDRPGQAYGDDSFGGMGDYGFDAPPLDLGIQETPSKRPRHHSREPSIAASRAESIARAVQFGEGSDHPLAIFDASRAGTESLAQSTPTKSVVSESDGRVSKNTGMAMGLLRRELEAIESDDKVLNFDKISEKVSALATSRDSELSRRRPSVQHQRSSLSCLLWAHEIASNLIRPVRMGILRSDRQRDCGKESPRDDLNGNSG